MNRRTFLKGLAAVPALAVIPAAVAAEPRAFTREQIAKWQADYPPLTASELLARRAEISAEFERAQAKLLQPFIERAMRAGVLTAGPR